MDGIRKQVFIQLNDPNKCEDLLCSTEAEHNNGAHTRVKLT